jgi:hypothetical protein
MIGEPASSFKRRSQELLLKAKQEASDADFKAKQVEVKKKRALDKKQKEVERNKRRMNRERRKKEKEAKQELNEQKRKEAAEKGEIFEEPAEDVEDEAASEEDEPVEEEDETVEEPPEVTLTADEKKSWFRKKASSDLSVQALGVGFQKFSLPDKDDGFDEVRYDWQKADKCKEYMKTWIQERKTTIRIEDLQPSETFHNKLRDWHNKLKEWHAKQQAYRATLVKREEEKTARTAQRAAKAKATAAKKELGEQPLAEGQSAETEGVADPEPEEDEATPIDFNKLDVFGVEDFLDVGGGQPLFSEFTFEDWSMMSLRFEIHLLIHSFRRDTNDPDRIGIHADHLLFYYTKYYKKQLSLKFFGVEHLKEVIDLVRDTVVITKTNVVEAQIPDDLESPGIFVMLTEEARRDRSRRIDLGEESARLKIVQPAGVVLGVQPPGCSVPSIPRPVAPGFGLMNMAAMAGSTGMSGISNVVRPTGPIAAPGAIPALPSGQSGGASAGSQGWWQQRPQNQSQWMGFNQQAATVRPPQSGSFLQRPQQFQAPGCAGKGWGGKGGW